MSTKATINWFKLRTWILIFIGSGVFWTVLIIITLKLWKWITQIIG